MATVAQKRAARNYTRRRKESRNPRSDDLQRALAQSLRDAWPDHFNNAGGIALLKAVMTSAHARLVRRGFDAKASSRRLAQMLKSIKAITRGGDVIDGVSEADAYGVWIPPHRRY